MDQKLKPVLIKIDKERWELLKLLAKDQGVSASSIVRQLIKEKLESYS